LAAEIQQKFGIEPQLIKGRSGVFEVQLNDELVFSKKSLGRFPEDGEVSQTLEGKLQAVGA
jgi:selenoprotein W-related protein